MKFRYLLIFISLLFVSCAIFIPAYSDYSNAKKSFKNKQYDSAVYYVSSSLHAKPNNKKGIKLLEIAYPQAVKYHQQRVNSLRLIVTSRSLNNHPIRPEPKRFCRQNIVLVSIGDDYHPIPMQHINHDKRQVCLVQKCRSPIGTQ